MEIGIRMAAVVEEDVEEAEAAAAAGTTTVHVEIVTATIARVAVVEEDVEVEDTMIVPVTNLRMMINMQEIATIIKER